MTQTAKRPPNPACEGCHHSQSFHEPKDGRKKRKCRAFGCGCKALVLPKPEKKA